MHPDALAAIWVDLHTCPFVDLRVDDHVTPEQIIVVYRWFNSYESEKELRSAFGFPEDSIRAWCKDITAKIAGLRKIKIDPNWEDDDGLTLAVTVDGVHYRTDEPRPFSKSYKSHKMGQAGLDYEYGIYTHKNKVAWINRPFPAGTNDKTVYRSKLKAAVEKKQKERKNNFKVIADDGYTANDLLKTLSLRNEFDPRDLAYFKDRALSRHERFNGMTKNAYNILCINFRHDPGWNEKREHPRHKAVVEAICVTLQYELDLGIKTLLDPYP